MYNYSRDGISMAAMIDTRTINAEGKYPVRIRVNHQRKRKYIPTGKALTRADVYEMLITNRKISIESIYLATGFTTRSTFNRLFKEQYATTPVEMRDAAKQKEKIRSEKSNCPKKVRNSNLSAAANFRKL